jgi:peptide/nickel transport system substrate-binding protein
MFTDGPASPYPLAWARRFRSDERASRANQWSGTNITRYSNPAYDALHDRAQVAIDEREQDAIWLEMLALVRDDVVEIPVVWRGGVAAVHNRIKNWTSSVFGATPVAFLKDWTL